MKIIVDTNVIARLIIDSDIEQAKIAADLIDRAEEVIIPTHVFCELAWILLSIYKFNREKIQFAIESVLNIDRLTVREDEVEAGLRMMEKGGDFADGVNEYTGRVMARGLSVFVSFDKQAVRLLTERGISAMVPT